MNRLTSDPVQPAAAASAPAVVTVHLLADDEHSRIEWHRFEGTNTRPLFITFDPLLYLWPKPAFGLDFLLRLGVEVIAVRRKAEHFYQPLSREAFLVAVAPALESARLAGRRVVAYGSSLGAYAALYYAHDLDAEVIALSPRVSVHPEFGTAAWQARAPFLHERFDASLPTHCRATIVYDPREPIDRRFIDNGLRPAFSAATWIRLPFAGHPASQFLGEIHYLSKWIRAVATSQPPPPLDRRAGRRLSATWHQVVADLCVRRGRLALADSLVERSLALRGRNMLAHRTRGLLKTLQRDWPQAVESLEFALKLDPADLLTQAMLARAKRAQEAPVSAGAGPVTLASIADRDVVTPAPLWRRLARRLQRALQRR